MSNWLTIAVQCHHFEHRLNWMISSLAGQHGVCLDVACVKNGATVDAMRYHYYGRECDGRVTTFEDMSALQYRGLTRNAQVAGCTTPYMLFADCDMVYHPEYFARLRQHAFDMGASDMLIAGRISQPNDQRRFTNRLVRANGPYPCVVDEPSGKASQLPPKRRGNVGAGYFQLVRTVDCDGYYVDAAKNRDHGWTDTYSKCKSDQQFRKRFTRVKLPRWFSDNEWHLNHVRDNELGKHTEEQR